MKKAMPDREKHSVDQLMRKVAQTLVRDFQNNLNDPCFCSDFQSALMTGNIARIREASPAPAEWMDVARYKSTYQLQNVFKRYRFREDIYSDEVLTENAINGFLETQTRLRNLELDQLPAKTQLILDVAAHYISRVLGKYDDEEHRLLCRFGRKASVGVPARLACEAQRWEIPISGSREQISWFDSEMSQIPHVQEYWAAQIGCDAEEFSQLSPYQEVSSLTLTLVPKTFKSLRAIMPNTTIGSYMSYGLGEIIRKRLKREGYDIAKLQMRHRQLARHASMHNLHVTADLTSASDSITVALVDRLFPEDWREILHQSRIGQVVLPNGLSVESVTFCTMGIGYTFPLQTLVFLALLKAIQAVSYDRRDRRTISVYGDDLIYASRMHDTVVPVFKQLGFVINLDKTFHDCQFRESCGGDYYHGVDVRPFQPQNGSASVGSKTYEAILYKYVNTLLARWTEYEIGGTLTFLMSELAAVTGKAKLVPGDFPDDAGIKCPTLTTHEFLRGAPVAQPKHIGHGQYRFSFLRFTPEERKEERHGPYYWAALRDGGRIFDPHWVTKPTAWRNGSFVRDLLEITCKISHGESPLTTRVLQPIKTTRSCITGRRLRRTATFVAVSHTGRYTRQSGTSGFEDRR